MENKGVVLLVEDNAALNDSNSRALRLRGYTVLTALTLREARERLAEREPDVILLDVMLPDGDGFDFCAKIEGSTTAHILFLTAKTEHGDRVRGLLLGGDDYITKPFHPEELLARIDAAMRRREKDRPAQTITRGALALDAVACRAFINGVDMLLKPKEFALLLILMQNFGKTIPSEALYYQAWKAPLNNDSRALRKHLSSIRKQLEETDSGFTIVNDRGEGYRFAADSEKNTEKCEGLVTLLHFSLVHGIIDASI